VQALDLDHALGPLLVEGAGGAVDDDDAVEEEVDLVGEEQPADVEVGEAVAGGVDQLEVVGVLVGDEVLRGGEAALVNAAWRRGRCRRWRRGR
jgi:hypothetical protein